LNVDDEIQTNEIECHDNETSIDYNYNENQTDEIFVINKSIEGIKYGENTNQTDCILLSDKSCSNIVEYDHKNDQTDTII
jgi:hypothetical protein